jgi:hypothetical protein
MKLTTFDAARREFLHLIAAVPLAATCAEAADSNAMATLPVPTNLANAS